jgi:hypothetical protein
MKIRTTGRIRDSDADGSCMMLAMRGKFLLVELAEQGGGTWRSCGGLIRLPASEAHLPTFDPAWGIARITANIFSFNA